MNCIVCNQISHQSLHLWLLLQTEKLEHCWPGILPFVKLIGTKSLPCLVKAPKLEHCSLDSQHLVMFPAGLSP